MGAAEGHWEHVKQGQEKEEEENGLESETCALSITLV